jgi:hypothetical protein
MVIETDWRWEIPMEIWKEIRKMTEIGMGKHWVRRMEILKN